LNIAWKFIYTAKDSWLGPTQNLGSVPALYNLTMDPYEKYDMIFNGAAPMRALSTSPGKYSGEDNGWTGALLGMALSRFRQIDHQVSQHQAVRGWRLERLDTGPAAS